MAAGDYVPCPICRGERVMIYGNPACPECMTKAGHPLSSYRLSDKTLDEARKQTLVVNLFAGPGAGKSTLCAGIFYDLKTLDINCEMSREFAKDLVWEKRTLAFEDQIYILGEQYHRAFVLLGKVDVIITDCPLLLGVIYDKHIGASFEELIVNEHKKIWNYNVFLTRKKKYNPLGRNQTEAEAQEIDRRVLDVLDKHDEMYEVFEGSDEGKTAIVKKILLLLENKASLKGSDS